MRVVLDVSPLVDWIRTELVPAVRHGDSYARRVGGPPDVYGLADVVCILATLGDLDASVSARDRWQRAFDELQDPETGLFVEREPSHLAVHANAFTVAAMDLLGLRPQWPMTAFAPYAKCSAIEPWLRDELSWTEHTYLWSHSGAGLASLAILLPDQFETGWLDEFFARLETRLDPATGMFGTAKPRTGDLDQVGGTFHYCFLYEHRRRELPGAAARVDAVLGLQQADGLWDPTNPFWLTLDGVYLLTRSVLRAPRRSDDVVDAVRRASAAVIQLVGDDPWSVFGGDLGVHSVTAAVSLLAEAQRFLGQREIGTGKPLNLVLDRRPFV
jgi:hypothetical protein